MKKSWRLLSMVGVLVVLGGAYVLASKTPKKQEAATPETKTIDLLKLDKTKIKGIIIKSKDNELSAQKNGDSWVVPAAKFPVKADSLNTLVTTLSDLTAIRLVDDNPSDLKQYGLDNPALTVTVKLDGSDDKVVEVGDAVPNGTDNYVKLKNVNKVYTVASATTSSFSIKLDDLRDKSIGMVDTSTINYLKVTAGGKTIELKPDESQYTTQPGLNIFQYYSYAVGAKQESLQTLTQALGNITADQFIEADAKDLKKYGLDKPSLDILVKDMNNKSIEILVGKDKDTDKAYFKTATSNTVYAVNKSSITPFTNIKAFDLYDKDVFLVNIDNVDQIYIKSPSSNYDIQLSRQTKKAEKQGDNDTVVTSYKVNGSNVEEEKFRSAYQKLIGLQVDSENDKNVSGTSEVSVIYHLNKGAEKLVTINFIPYNDEFYSVFLNGKSEFLISKSKVNDMVAAFNFK